MCGILLCVLDTKEDSVPSQFIGGKDHDAGYIWESSNERLVHDLVANHYNATTQLSAKDQRKLANVDQIRSLHKELSRVKNSIAKTPNDKHTLDAQIQAITEKITSLSDGSSSNNETVASIAASEYADVQSNITNQEFLSLVPVIAARGPDYISFWNQKFNTVQSIQLFSSVLSLRQPFVRQPVQIDHNRFILQFNGELYNEQCLETNDTSYLTNLLLEKLSNTNTVSQAIVETFSELQGEFAYVIVDQMTSTIYFGRDCVGRRSLVYRTNNEMTNIIISSVGDEKFGQYLECEAGQVYSFSNNNLETTRFSTNHAIEMNTTIYPNLDAQTVGIQERLDLFHKVFRRACEIRMSTVHPLNEDSNYCNIGILFSGGLDCTIIGGMFAQIAHENYRIKNKKLIIDLFTVGFDNPRTQTTSSDSPDRKLARKSFEELARKFNNDTVEFHLIEVDVTYDEWLRNRHRVQSLIQPCGTEMDLSIAIAFYFASRGNGTKLSLDGGNIISQKSFNSKAKVLFSGLGADELFAGYSRHERIFSNFKVDVDTDTIQASYNELAKELQKDIQIIHKRNLGRDDRAISSWGKELRYPYLDESVIKFVMTQLEINLKFNYTWVTNTNRKGKTSTRIDPVRKWFLREYAEYLGLNWVKHELKRAIQFGAKSAKLEIGQSKTKGTDTIEI